MKLVKILAKFIVTGLIGSFMLGGCKDRKVPDVSSLLQPVEIGRLDMELFRLDTLLPDVLVLKNKYGRYWDAYTAGVLNLGTVADSDFMNVFPLFIKDRVMREVADSVALAFPDMKDQEEELSRAFAYYAYYFPGYLIPRVYTHISGFNQSVIVDSAIVGIGLDNYLGEHCIFYNMLAVPVPVYARKKMTGDDIVRDVLSGWICSEFPFRPVKNDLISGMIYQGKVAYLLEKLFPLRAVHWLLGFTPEQEKWCEDNESQIWGFLIENNYLFTTQQKVVMKYLNDAPYTSGMPLESPGKTVVWTGFQIVRKYMEKEPGGMEELMKEQDYHKILRVSGYRP